MKAGKRAGVPTRGRGVLPALADALVNAMYPPPDRRQTSRLMRPTSTPARAALRGSEKRYSYASK